MEQEIYDKMVDSDDEEQLTIDMSSPSKKMSIPNGTEQADNAEPSGASVFEDIKQEESSMICMDGNGDVNVRSITPPVQLQGESLTSPPLKPIPAVLNRNKPQNHSTQTRYGTRIRSSSLPQSRRFSSSDPPFGCDPKASGLQELHAKLTEWHKKINGKNDAKFIKSPPPPVTKAKITELKKTLKTLSRADVENHIDDGPDVEAPGNFSGQKNGTSHAHTHEAAAGSPALEISNDKDQEALMLGNIPLQRSHLVQSDKLLAQKHAIAVAESVRRREQEAKRREQESVRRLQEYRAREEEKSKIEAEFNTKLLEFFTELLPVVNSLNKNPDDEKVSSYLPRPKGTLPFWSILASTSSKSSALVSQLESAIPDPAAVDHNLRTRTHNESEEKQIPDDVNVTSGSLDIPEDLTTTEEHAIKCLAVNFAIRNKTPKKITEHKPLSFEALKNIIESDIKNTLIAEEKRRERKAQGFGLPPRLIHPSANNPVINIRPAATQQQLIPVPVNLVPVTSLQPTQLKLIGTYKTSNTISTPRSAVAQSATTLFPPSNGQTSSPSPQKPSPNKHSFKCPQCDYISTSKSHLRRHVITVHSDIKPFQCYVCQATFARGEKCKHHMEREHPGTVYDSKRTRIQQVQLAADGVQWPLNVSAVTEESPARVDDEMQDVSQDGTVGSTADETQSSSNDALEINSEEEEEQEEDNDEEGDNFMGGKKVSITCNQCNFVASRIPKLQKHIMDAHVTVRRLKCGVCHYSSGKKIKMIEHMKKHNELFCFYCDFSCIGIALFRCHSRFCQRQQQWNSLTCQLCCRDYHTRKQLEEHVADEHNKEIFFCDMCSFSAMDFQVLEQHEKKHVSGELESQCGKCHKLFDKTDDFQSHSTKCSMDSSVHTKRCSQCKFSSVQTTELLDHLRTHINADLIPCVMQGCKFLARWSATMDTHMILKHKIGTNQPQPKKRKPKKPEPPKKTTEKRTSKGIRLIQQVPIQPNPPVSQNARALATVTQMTSSTSSVPPKPSGTFIRSPWISGQPITLPVYNPVFSNTFPLHNVTMVSAAPQSNIVRQPQTSLFHQAPMILQPQAANLLQPQPANLLQPQPANLLQPQAHTNLYQLVANAVVNQPVTRPGPMPLSLTSQSPKKRRNRKQSMPVTPPTTLGTVTITDEINTVYDEGSGGIRGHGSGTYLCPHCPHRGPFTYRRSYEKHMYKHDKPGKSALSPHSFEEPHSTMTLKMDPANEACISKCPVIGCDSAYNSYKLLDTHLIMSHGINNAPIKEETLKLQGNPGEPMVIDLDSDEEEEEEEEENAIVDQQPGSSANTDSTNNGVLTKHDNGDVEFVVYHVEEEEKVENEKGEGGALDLSVSEEKDVEVEMNVEENGDDDDDDDDGDSDSSSDGEGSDSGSSGSSSSSSSSEDAEPEPE